MHRIPTSGTSKPQSSVRSEAFSASRLRFALPRRNALLLRLLQPVLLVGLLGLPVLVLLRGVLLSSAYAYPYSYASSYYPYSSAYYGAYSSAYAYPYSSAYYGARAYSPYYY